MRIEGRHYRTIWLHDNGWSVQVIDQTLLPHRFEIRRLDTVEDVARAIRTMQVRGAPLIGASAAYGMCLAARMDASQASLEKAAEFLNAQRPTAVNLRWATRRMLQVILEAAASDRVAVAYAEAGRICDEDVEICRRIGVHGLALLRELAHAKKSDGPLNILTHCNAGWIACVDWGTATAPIYMAHDAGIPIHVWVDETRPRNQGARLTAYELGSHGIPHTIVVDNAGGLLMQQGLVDLVLVGTDRVARNGDVANKIGTYLKALAARDNDVPFYVALPSTTIDWQCTGGAHIEIEERGADEVLQLSGPTSDGRLETISIGAPGSPARNPAFDVTEARLVTRLITEAGVCDASEDGLSSLYPETSRQ